MYGSSSRPFTVEELLDRLRRAVGDRCVVAVDQGARQLQLTGLGDGCAVDQEEQFNQDVDGAVRRPENPAEPRRPDRAALPNPSRAALPRSLAPPSRPSATTAAVAARATTVAGGGATGSTGSAAGAGGSGGATGSAGGAAGAKGAGPTTDRHFLSWPLSQQLQWLGVDSGGHCLSRMTPPLSSFASGFFSRPVQVVEALVFSVLHRGGCRCASESAAALGTGESTSALDASESATALGARASPATGPSSAEALHTFTLDSGASHCFFRYCTTLTPLAAPVPVSLADPTVGLVVARASTVLPCPGVPSGSLSGLHLPTFSTNLVSNAAIQDVLVDTFIHGGQRVAICTMHSRLLVSGLRRSLPSLPRSSAPASLPCVEGRQRAAPHSSEFPPITAPLQTLYMDVWAPAPVGGTDQERYFLLVVDDYTCYTNVFPVQRKADVSGVLIPWIRATRRQLCEWFSQDFPVLRLHSDRGVEFSSDLLAELCQDEGIHQSFTLPASPQQNGIAERCIGLIMEVARTSMIHAAAPHFLWPFAVQNAAHQLNLWPRVSEPKTSPTLQWTGKVGDASVFRVGGALSLVRDAKASKLSFCTHRCVFLGFPTDAPPLQFYYPRERRVFSQDVTFDESGPAPSGVSQVDPPPLVEPLEISSDSSGPAEGADPAADDTAATRRSPRLETPPGFPPRPSSPPPQPAAVDSGAETTGAEPGGAETDVAGSRGAATWGAATGGVGYGGALTGGAGSWGAMTGGADSRGTASPRGGGDVGDPAGGPGVGQPPQPDLIETLSPQAIRTWIVRRDSPGGGGYDLAGAGAVRPGGTTGAGGTARGAGGAAGAGGTRGAAGAGGDRATSPRGATGAGGAGPTSFGCTAGAGGASGAGGAGAGGTGGAGAPGPGGARTGAAGAARGAAGAGGAVGATTGGAGAGGAGAGGTGAAGAGGAGAAGSAPHRLFFYPQPQSSLLPPDSVLPQVLSLPSSTGLTPPLLCSPTDQSPPQLLPCSLLPAPAPHTEKTESLTERRESETRASTPVRARRVAHPHPSAVPCTHGMTLRPSSSDLARAASPTVTRLLATVFTDLDLESTAPFALVTELVDFAARCRLDYVASLVTESVCPPSVRSEPALCSGILEDRQFELECLAALPRFASMRLCPEGDPNALDIPTPRSYAEAIAGGRLLLDLLPHPKDDYSSGATARCSTALLRAALPQLLHIFLSGQPSRGDLAAPPTWLHWVVSCGYPGEPPAASLQSPPGASRVARHTENHTCGSWFCLYLSRFCVLMYVDDLVFATADTEALALFSLPQPTPLSTGHSLSAPTSDESVELSGPYPELVGCLMYLMTCTRPDLAYPLSLLARYVAPGRHRKVHLDAAKRVLRYLCNTSGMGLMLGGQDSVVLTRQSNASWADDQITQCSSQGYTLSLGSGSVLWRKTRSSSVLGSSYETEIYARAMAAQELRWLTYLLTDLGERPRSPPVLYVYNKAMLALCHKQRMEHRMKHIALRYFLACQLQQRRQLCLSYVASRANTADVFTKALGSGDHQRFCTALGLVSTLPHLLVA
ncbi:unnamed protein product [Closterium sp. NIES-54]